MTRHWSDARPAQETRCSIFRQLFDPTSSTYTYLLGCSVTKEAVLIDPVFEQVRRDAALIAELGLEPHVVAGDARPCRPRHRRLAAEAARAAARSRWPRRAARAGADRLLKDGDRVEFGRRSLEVRATPGHTNGCLTYVLDDESMAFTGDCMMIRGSGRTDFQQGDRARCTARCARGSSRLPESCLLYPAHDYRGLTVDQRRRGEEVQSAARRRGRRGRLCRLHEEPRPAAPQEDRRGGAGQSALRPARQRGGDVPPTIPTGRRCASPSAASGRSSRTGWRRTSPTVHVLDVREPDEFTGPLGHIRGATLVPLGELAARAREVPQGQADRRGVPRRQPLGAGHGDPAEGRLHRVSPTCQAACCAGAPKVGRSTEGQHKVLWRPGSSREETTWRRRFSI